MADIDLLVQELIDAAVREGGAEAVHERPIQRYYDATHAARIALMEAIAGGAPSQAQSFEEWLDGEPVDAPGIKRREIFTDRERFWAEAAFNAARKASTEGSNSKAAATGERSEVTR